MSSIMCKLNEEIDLDGYVEEEDEDFEFSAYELESDSSSSSDDDECGATSDEEEVLDHNGKRGECGATSDEEEVYILYQFKLNK